MRTVPSLEPSGHNGAVLSPIAICPSEQPASPVAPDGLTETPSGRSTTTSRRWLVAIASGSNSPSCGNSRSNARPDAPSRTPDDAATLDTGSNGIPEQPVTAGASSTTGSENTSGHCQLFITNEVGNNNPLHSGGFVKNALPDDPGGTPSSIVNAPKIR